MLVISLILLVFGVAGVVVSYYLFKNVKSPILKLREELNSGAVNSPSLQTILDLFFTYFIVLHIMFILIALNFLLR